MAEPQLAVLAASVTVRSAMVLRILHGEGLRGIRTGHEAVCWSTHVKLLRTTRQQEMLESARACSVLEFRVPGPEAQGATSRA